MSVAKYVETVTSEAAHGVAETTHYAALKELLNEAGDELTPKHPPQPYGHASALPRALDPTESFGQSKS